MEQNMKCSATETPDDIDIPALRERYRYERDRRRRAEGYQQYTDVAVHGDDWYENDPWVPAAKRAPVTEDVDVAILGGGFAGMIAAARLKGVGVNGIRIIDMAGDFGGTWYWNRYPGLQCDIESYLYMPLLDEVDYVPKHKYSFGEEIFEHCQRMADHFGLYEHALFGTSITSLKWEESVKRWCIRSKQGDCIRARFIVMALGYYNKPKLPGIPGMDSFKGHTFHTSRWDYDYTGGDRKGGLNSLADKRVAIIGTGSTALQVVPFLGEYAKHLYVFQRTPSYVAERNNRPTDSEWAKSLKPGWQAERLLKASNGTSFQGFSPGQEDIVCDGWSEINRNIAARLAAMGNPKITPEQFAELRETEDYRVMERLRRRVDNIVADRKTAETLKAWYRFLCKRPGFSDEYLPTFNRPNVTLIDVSDTKGVECVTETGIVARGVEYDVDCIVYASGYEFTTNLKRRYGLEAIEGRGGVSLYDHWATGYETLHGLMTQKFPNQFFTGFTQGAVGNLSALYNQQGSHIAYIIKEALARGAASVEPSPEAEAAWVKHVRDAAGGFEQFLRECTPGTFNSEGAEVFQTPLGETYGPGFYAFDRLLQEWRDKGDLGGLILEE